MVQRSSRTPRLPADHSWMVQIVEWPLEEQGGINELLRRATASAQRLSYSLDPAIRPFFSFADPGYTTGTMLKEEISKAEKFLNRPPANPRRHATKVRPQWERRTVMTTAISTCEWVSMKAFA
jgi:hypothetical protein